MIPDPESVAARSRLGHEMCSAIQLQALSAAFRALLHAHPEKESVRLAYDQIVGQVLARPPVLGDKDVGLVLRDISATLFQPPVAL